MAMVAPYLVDKNDPLYAVNGVFNAIFVHGNMLGDAMFYGQGAGKEATASAVVGDVIEEAQLLGKGVIASWSPEKQVLTDVSGTSKRFFVRVKGNAADCSSAEEAFGKIEVVDAGLEQEYGFVTECMTEAEYEERVSKMENVLGMLRIR